MSVQKQKHTKGRRDRARVQFEIKNQKLVKCSKCGAMIKSHRACPKCGYYKGKEAVNTLKKVTKNKK